MGVKTEFFDKNGVEFTVIDDVRSLCSLNAIGTIIQDTDGVFCIEHKGGIIPLMNSSDYDHPAEILKAVKNV